MITAKLKHRGTDKWGSGAFGAPRGDREHNGIDYCVAICSPATGEVTKLGYPYADDLSYRYVQITDSSHQDHRIFYIEPSVSVGDLVEQGDAIGTPQYLGRRYAAITEHVHYEIKDGHKFLDPEDVARTTNLPNWKEADKD